VRVRVEIADADIQVVLERVEDFMSEHVPRIIVTVVSKWLVRSSAFSTRPWDGEAESQRLERHDFEERLQIRWGERSVSSACCSQLPGVRGPGKHPPQKQRGARIGGDRSTSFCGFTRGVSSSR